MKSLICLFLVAYSAMSFAEAPIPEDCAVNVMTTSQGFTDLDADGVADAIDNCLLVPNCDQRDTDGDDFGNICDADLNNDLIVNVQDLALLKSVFFTDDPNADFDGDGSVSFADLGILRSYYFQNPGPNGPCLADPGSCVGPVYFELDDTGQSAPGNLFVFTTSDPATIHHGRRLISGMSVCNRSVMAQTYHGVEWYNPDWGFHIEGDIWFFGSNIYAPDYCDRTAGYVQANLGWWCAARGGLFCGYWCPWHSALVREVTPPQ